ncbi:MAG: PilZ protein [Paucimonas sp.]|jgi:hypothetical protein|nr:PilZ protein [Paucimonas sp.]
METLSGFNLGGDSQARTHVRRPLRKPGKLVLNGQRSFDVRTVDISLNGVCVMVEAPLPVGEKCSVAIDVFFQNQSHKLLFEGRVVYCLLKGMEGFRTGVFATNINPEGTRYINALFQ